MPSFYEYALTYSNGIVVASDGTDLWAIQNTYVVKINVDGTRTYYSRAGVSDACYQMCKLGNYMWTVDLANNKWHQIKIADGTVTSYSAPTSASPLGICTDGTWLYVAGYGTSKIYKVDPADGSVKATWDCTSGSSPARIIYASNGDLYYSSIGLGKVSRMNTSGTVVGDYGSSLTNVTDLAQGTDDGNIWFSCTGTTRTVGKCTLTGTVTTYTSGIDSSGSTRGMCSGPAGSNVMYFLDNSVAKIYQVTTSGTITAITAPVVKNQCCTLGPDSQLWYSVANDTSSKVTKLTIAEPTRSRAAARQAVQRAATG